MRRQFCFVVSRRYDIGGLVDLFQSSAENAEERKQRLEHRWRRLPRKSLALCNECWLPRLRRKRPHQLPLLAVSVFRRLTRRQCNRSFAFLLHRWTFDTLRQSKYVRAQSINGPKLKSKKLSELRVQAGPPCDRCGTCFRAKCSPPKRRLAVKAIRPRNSREPSARSIELFT